MKYLYGTSIQYVTLVVMLSCYIFHFREHTSDDNDVPDTKRREVVPNACVQQMASKTTTSTRRVIKIKRKSDSFSTLYRENTFHLRRYRRLTVLYCCT